MKERACVGVMLHIFPHFPFYYAIRRLSSAVVVECRSTVGVSIILYHTLVEPLRIIAVIAC